MAYSASYSFSATSGLTLKWSLVSAGTLHATLRNQTTGFYESGTSGFYEWVASTIPDDFRGVVVFHTNTASALSDLVKATTYAQGSVNPGEIERVEKALPNAAADAAGGLSTSRQAARMMHLSDEVYFVRTDGNDSNDGLTPSTAKLTIAGATAIAGSGSTILLGDGSYTEDVDLPSGVALVGGGPYRVSISGSVMPGGSNALRGFRVIAPSPSGACIRGGNGGTMADLILDASSGDDAWLDYDGSNFGGRWVVERVQFISGNDGIVLGEGGGGGASTAHVVLIDCHILIPAVDSATDQPQGIAASECRLHMEGGSIQVPATANVVHGVRAATSATVTLHGVAISTSSPNGTDLVQETSATITASDCTGSGTGGILSTSGTVTVQQSLRPTTAGRTLTVESSGGVTLGNVAHGGTSATLRLGGSTETPALYITNSGGDAARLEGGGATGDGLHVSSVATSGHGFHVVGTEEGIHVESDGGAALGLTSPTYGVLIDPGGGVGIGGSGGIDVGNITAQVLSDILEDTGTTIPAAIPSASTIAAALASTANLTILAAATGSTLDVYGKDSYANADGRGITITKASTETHWPTTLSEVHFYCSPAPSTLEDDSDAASLSAIACTVTTATGDSRAFRLDLTTAQLTTLTTGRYLFWFVANKSTNIATLRSGAMNVRAAPAALS